MVQGGEVMAKNKRYKRLAKRLIGHCMASYGKANIGCHGCKHKKYCDDMSKIMLPEELAHRKVEEYFFNRRVE